VDRIAFDVFAQFSYQFWLVAIAFGIAFFMPFARVLSGIAITVIGLLVIGIMPHLTAASYPAPEVKPPADHRVLRVMSFNTWLENANVDAIAAEVERNDPDILVLLEFGNEKRALLDKLKARWPYQDDCRHLDHCYMAVVSKFPIADFESHASWVGPPMVRASFGKELGGLTVIGTHTIRFPYMRAQLTQLNELADLIRKLEGPPRRDGRFQRHAVLASAFDIRAKKHLAPPGWLAADLARQFPDAAARHRPHLRQPGSEEPGEGTHRR
jgi:endonuclease/exonuclease/phosphatase (EEP) superfamily protein YafD